MTDEEKTGDLGRRVPYGVEEVLGVGPVQSRRDAHGRLVGEFRGGQLPGLPGAPGRGAQDEVR
ncbi:hypothetical protein ACFV2Q_26820 [Streptomyces sp. NPDC059650]|uniref:hypothetical protein n=1 Tax=Streptomyces sp. NPDC059650 TaxID=3346896 RepID=UPI0036AF51F7